MKAYWIIALQGLRGARADFIWFAWAILLSVAMATGLTTLTRGLGDGVNRETRALLAADLRLESTAPLPEGWRERLQRPGWRVIENLEFNAMLRNPANDRTLLVEVLAAAPEHPLRGAVELHSGQSLASALKNNGTIAESPVSERLALPIGAPVQLGQKKLFLTDRLAREPDRVSRFFRWGPRLIIPLEAVEATGLIGFGSRLTHVTLIALPEGEDPVQVARQLTAETLGMGIRVMTPADGQMSARRFIDRFTLFLQILTLLILLTCGNAIAGAMAAHARENRQQIAILRALGVDPWRTVAILLTRIQLVAIPSSLIGAALGCGWPLLIATPLTASPTGSAPFATSIFLIGTLGGILGSLLFSLGALWSTRLVSPMGLFRAVDWSGGNDFLQLKWRWGLPMTTVLVAALLIGLQSGWKLALLLAIGLGGGIMLLFVVAWGFLFLLRRLDPDSLVWRLALHTLTARGGIGTLLSLGLGMATLSSILLIEQNLDRQLVEHLPTRVASFFLLDVQPDQEEPLRAIASRYAHHPDDLRVTPVVRGRIQALNGRHITPEFAASHPQTWRFQRDYVLTWARDPPPGNPIIAGRWWSDPGAVEVSLEKEMARDLKLGLGDSVGFSILGIEVSATITSIREVAWSDMSLNFFVIFSPAVIRGAPFSHLASMRLDPAQEEPFRMEVTQRMNNVSLIAAREVMERAAEMLKKLLDGVRVAGAAAVVASLIALRVAISLPGRRRTRETAITRLLGADRRDLRRVVWLEFLLMGLCASCAGLLVGQGITWAVIRFAVNDRWEWLPGVSAWILLGGTGVIASAGYLAARQELNRPILSVLRGHE
ncbi:MAG: hypothetical protein H7834_00425 [Magnetococcus sp. YQC-9]